MGDMMKIWMILALGILIAGGSTIVSAATQEPEGEMKEIDAGNEPQGDPENKSEGPQGYTELFGQFELDDEKVSGSYVGFGKLDGAIVNYSFFPENEIVFSSISSSSNLFRNENSRMEDAVFHAEFDGLHFMSHNNPTSMIHITYSGDDRINVSFTLQEGLIFGEDEGEGLPIDGLGSEARISTGTEQYTLNGSVLNISMTDDTVISFFRSQTQTMSSFQMSLQKAISEKKVDGELQVMVKEGETTQSQHFPYQGKVEMEVKGSEIGKMVKIEVQSQEKAGKTLMFKVQGEVLDDVDVGKVRIEFDGKKAVKAGSVNEVLNGDPTQCMYYLEKDENGCYQAMVYVPGFSTHEIALMVEDDTNDSSFLPFGLMVLMVSIVSLIGIAVIMGRKK